MSLTIQFEKHGGPEVLEVVDLPVGDPGPGQVRVRHHAIGLNFIDIYHRTGLYPQPLPGRLGTEAAGVVEAVGPGVTRVRPGDRVAYCSGPLGAYSEVRVMPEAPLVKLPDDIDFETAAAVMLKGMTVQYLFNRTHKLQPGEVALFHAAAGGVGLIAGQWARAIGAELIGTAGSEDKCALAKANGYAHVINYNTEDFVARVREITGGRGVPVVYDSIGRDTWERSLACLRPFGLMVSFGNSSGAVPPFSVGDLAKGGSLYVTRPTLMTHVSDPAVQAEMAEDLFGMLRSGAVKVQINQRYVLADAAKAQAELAARKTVGSTVMIPG